MIKMPEADKNLGKKIRELRIREGITQKELAGDKITRNMLSLIESGTASPSVSTLLYIAEKLKTPAGYFFSSTTDDEGRFLKLTVIENIKDSFSQKKYRECEEMCTEIPQDAIDDELSYILASSYMMTAAESAEKIRFRDALYDLERALLYSSRSIYCGESFGSSALFYREVIKSAASEQIPEIISSIESVSEFVPASLVEYFISLKLIKSGEKPPFSFARGSFYDRHVSALIMIADGKLHDSQKRLMDLSLDPDLPYYMQFRVLCDMEECANTIGDIKLAYSASRRKLELIEKFKV